MYSPNLNLTQSGNKMYSPHFNLTHLDQVGGQEGAFNDHEHDKEGDQDDQRPLPRAEHDEGDE